MIEKFPFIVIYTIQKRKKEIFVLSLFHTSRHPKTKRKK